MRWTRAVGGCALAMGLAACGGGGHHHPVVMVTTLADAGAGSLRDVVASAPAGAIVRFDAALSGDISLSSGEIILVRNVTIEGPGAGTIGVTSGGVGRAFSVPAGVHAAISGLHVFDCDGDFGGAIESDGTLTLDQLLIEGGAAHDTGRGGGVASLGTLVMRDCTIRACLAFNGGGVVCDGGTGHLERCTFDSNQTTGNSGAGLLVGDGVVASIVNCTFRDNEATGPSRVGGAIAVFSESESATLTMSFCTLSGNSATGQGGGVYVSPSSTLVVLDSIVAGNTAPEGPDLFADLGATITSLGHDVVGDGTASTLVHGVNGDLVGTTIAPIAPKLGPFGSNGGLTDTFSLQPASPAIDLVPNAAATDGEGHTVHEDQRGSPRPDGPASDAGAFES